jgi:hypothetical protein
VLVGPGGAGKTVALRKASLDCLDRTTALGRTGLVPCWLRLTRTPAEPGLRDLFRDAVAPDAQPADDNAVWDWLDAGPPVLLLCDLDDPQHVPPDRRGSLAGLLASLQGNERFSRRGHRIVVAYRSGGVLCPAANALLSGRHFQRYSLLELEPEAVLGYLTDLRAWASELSATSPSPLDPQLWGPFVERLERRPLLMHLLGSFFHGPAGPPATAGQLVARLVQEQLDLSLTRLPPGLIDRLPAHAQTHNLRRWVLTGLARASRLGWSRGQPSAPLPGQHLYDVLQDPLTHLPARPHSGYWHGDFSPYWDNEPGLAPFLAAVVDLLFTSPWVSRPDAEHYRVGPPVFANFFAAVLPVRYRQGPPLSLAAPPPPLPDVPAWLAEVLALWRQHLDAWAGEALHAQSAWQQAAALLAGLLGEQEFYGLVRAWLVSGDHRLLRLGFALLHGRHPADPPAPPQCPPHLLARLRDALAEAAQTGFVADPLTVGHELLGEDLRPALARFAGAPGGQG